MHHDENDTKKNGSGDKQKKAQTNYQMDYVMKMAAQRRQSQDASNEDSSSTSTEGEGIDDAKEGEEEEEK